MSKPIERYPHDAVLPRGWHAMHNYGIPYRPRDKPVQEDWGSVARKFGVGVKELIYFNFLTDDPDEVNWYLRHHTGCKKVSPSGNNWMFSNNANPGIIYIPPAEDTSMVFKPEEYCAWMPDNVKKFMLRLVAISQTMSGNKGQRIKKLVQVILQAGYPGCKDLWYYNDMNITTYVDIKTGGMKLREMTKATMGAFPFDGESGLYSQQGSLERHRGKWRIHAVNDLFDDFACGNWDVAALKSSLEDIDDLMYKGWYEITLVEAKSGMGGGSAFDPLVYEFINHVRFLTKDNTHLYSAFR